MKKTELDIQKIFNKSVKAMYEQGGPCKGHLNIGCMYHSPETGRKCIVGSILTQDELDSIPDTLQQNSINTVITYGHLTHLRPISAFLGSLQTAHDLGTGYKVSSTSAEWLPKMIALQLKTVAAMYNLDDKIVTQTFGKKK
jgi:hypothetical protein